MTQPNPEAPRVGVGVFVFRSQNSHEFLLGVRKGSHGAGTWSLPGGHLEFNETFSQCAEREILEETGLEIVDVRFLTAVESFFPLVDGGRHYVTVLMTAVLRDSESDAQLIEPDKCEGWHWRNFKQMRELSEDTPEKLFLPLRNLFVQREKVCEGMERDGAGGRG